jgi:hypothetical protein
MYGVLNCCDSENVRINASPEGADPSGEVVIYLLI